MTEHTHLLCNLVSAENCDMDIALRKEHHV